MTRLVTMLLVLLMGATTAVADNATFYRLEPQPPPILIDSTRQVALFDLTGDNDGDNQTGAYITGRMIQLMQAPNRLCAGEISPDMRRVVDWRTDTHGALDRALLRTNNIRSLFDKRGRLDNDDIREIGRHFDVGLVIWGRCTAEGQMDWQSFNVPGEMGGTQCPVIAATVEVDVYFADARTGEILKRHKTDRHLTERLCPWDKPEHRRISELAEAAADQLAAELVDQFVPGYQRTTFVFEDIEDTDVEASELAARLSAECQKHPEHADSWHDLALAHQMTGEYSRALEAIEQAIAIDAEDRYEAIRERIEAGLRLKQYYDSIRHISLDRADAPKTEVKEVTRVRWSDDNFQVYE